MQGDFSKKGTITIVDEKTGIFATAVYANNNRQSPKLSLETIDKGDTVYSNVLSALGCGENRLTLYSTKNNAKPTGGYTLYVPVSQDGLNAGKTYTIYSCTTDGEVQQLEMELDGNIYVGKADNICYLAIVESGNIIADIVDAKEFPWGIVAFGAVVVVAVIAIVINTIRQKKTNKAS